MKIVFWNINGKNLVQELTLLAQHINPDILILAECSLDSTTVLNCLNKHDVYYYHQDSICEKIHFFSKYNYSQIRIISSNKRYAVKNISVLGYPIFNLLSLHYPSKLNWNNEDQAAQVSELRNEIEQFEIQQNSTNTVLIGDFNMNPFENSMVQHTGLNSVMSKEIALKGGRMINGKVYSYFYNPMWSFFGDKGKNDKVNGTYYLNNSKPITYFWNIFDQVLIRPSFIEYFDEDKLDIITNLGNVNLLNKNNIINKNISDHLPISCIIKQ